MRRDRFYSFDENKIQHDKTKISNAPRLDFVTTVDNFGTLLARFGSPLVPFWRLWLPFLGSLLDSLGALLETLPLDFLTFEGSWRPFLL